MRDSLNDFSDPRRPILAARWTPLQSGKEWFVKEELVGDASHKIYGPMTAEQVPELIAELRAIVVQAFAGHLQSLT